MSRQLKSGLAPLAVVSLIALGACRSAPILPTARSVTTPPPAGRRPQLQFAKFLAFGDSLTEGLVTPGPSGESDSNPTRAFPAKLQVLLTARYRDQPIEVINAGRGGERAIDARPRFNAVLAEHRPSVVLLMTGTNDVFGPDDYPRIISAVADLVADARAQGAQVVVSTLPRERPGGRRAYAVERIVPFNAALTEWCRTSGTPLVDIYPSIGVDLLAPDGLHLLETANELIADQFLAKIRALFEVVR